ncbi:hypothetical protein NND47_04785, partial [Streptococcus mutans]|nr:hypothetical protein [Streptococcus mutans]MDT9527392.1 hypothetical protein [Streptococcus mutans]
GISEFSKSKNIGKAVGKGALSTVSSVGPLEGATIGATIGSVIPGFGTTAGAGLGFVVGSGIQVIKAFDSDFLIILLRKLRILCIKLVTPLKERPMQSPML